MAPLQSNGKIPPNSTLAAAMSTYAKVLNILVVNNSVLLIAFKLTINRQIEYPGGGTAIYGLYRYVPL